MSALRIVVTGAYGGLGGAIARGVEAADDMALAARVVRVPRAGDALATTSLADALAAGADVLFESTRPELAADHACLAIDHGVPVVVGTTAWDKPRVDAHARARGVPVLYAPNYALGAILLFRLAEQVAAHLPDVQLIEHHPASKIDRPSGTALHAAGRIAAVTGTQPEIHSLRLDGPISRHAIVFGTTGQTLELRHEATSNDCFIPAALVALRAVRSLPPGLTIGLEPLLGL